MKMWPWSPVSSQRLMALVGKQRLDMDMMQSPPGRRTRARYVLAVGSVGSQRE